MKEYIIEQILKLKQEPQTEKVKLQIQKLQQLLDESE